MNLESQRSYPVGVNDVWGYTDSNGTEYALVGTQTGVSIVDISTNPSVSNELFYIAGDTTTWRDLKTWGDYAFVIDESPKTIGMLVIDLSQLPGAIDTVTTDIGIGFTDCHNIFIDEFGIAYLFGAKSLGVGGGTLMVDLTVDPENPSYLGKYGQTSTNYIHDGYVKNNILYGSEIYDGHFSIVDVSDKSNPVILAEQSTPLTFTHACWPSDDGNTLFVVDEKNNAFVTSYDISNYSNIQELDRIQSYPGTNVAPHNTFVLNNYVVNSYYTSGVVIYDATYPNNLIEVANFDTSPNSGSGYSGCWGVYPYFPSGRVIATDRQQGLHVLNATYTQACYLEGDIVDAVSGNPIPGATITIQGITTSETESNFDGNYATGAAISGSYFIEVFAPGYDTQIIPIDLTTNGIIYTQHVFLNPTVPCASAPVGLSLNSVSFSNATIDWDIDYTANSYSIFYRIEGNTSWTSASSATNSISLTGLQYATNYELQVQSECDSGLSSPLSAILTFTTTEAPCIAPSFVSSTTSHNSATLSWNSIALAQSYSISYQTEGSSLWQSVTASSSPYILTGLNAETNYDWYIQTNCNGGSSNPSSTQSFTTESAPCIPPNPAWSVPSSATYSCDQTIDLNSLVSGDLGGTWSGGIYVTAAGIFDPIMAGVGGHLLTYTVETAIDCASVEVHELQVLDCAISIEAKAYLEGCFNIGNGNMDNQIQILGLLPIQQPYFEEPWLYSGSETITSTSTSIVDWLLMELRSNIDTSLLATKAVLLEQNGKITDAAGNNSIRFENVRPDQSYFVVLRHRNHLDVISKSDYSFPLVQAIDFSQEANVLGANQLSQLNPSFNGLRAGDINSEGVITVDDLNFYISESSLLNLYLNSDLNLDKTVTIADFNLYLKNASAIGMSAIRY